MKAIEIIYCRISDDREGKALGVERQKQHNLERATREGVTAWQTVTTVDEPWPEGKNLIVMENDFSASIRAKKPRKLYERVMEWTEQGKVTKIRGYSNSRLTRRPMELERLISANEKTGVQFVTIVSGDDDLSTGQGRMVARIKAAVDAAEADAISERTKDKNRQMRENGTVHHAGNRPLGYTRDFKIISDEAKMVTELFERVANGESLGTIATDWNERGIKTTKGNRWVAQVLRQIIKRRYYCGENWFNGQHIGNTNFEPIITRALQDRALATRKPGTATYNARTYLLASMVFCAHHDEPTIMTGKKHTDRESAYRCPHCHHIIKSNDLEGAIRRRVMHEVQAAGEPTVEKIDNTDAIRALEDEITELQQAGMTLKDVLPMIKARRTRIEELHEEEASTGPTGIEWLLQTSDDWTDSDVSANRARVAKFVRSITIRRPTVKFSRDFEYERVTVEWNTGKVETLVTPTVERYVS